MQEATEKKMPDFGIRNTRGIDEGWRSGSDYPIDREPEPKSAAETEDNSDV